MADPKKTNLDPVVEPDIPSPDDEEATLPEIDEQSEIAEDLSMQHRAATLSRASRNLPRRPPAFTE